LGDLGLKEQYQTDVNFRLEVNTIPSLAFLPPAEVPAAFRLLDRLVFVDHLLELLAYFESTYIRKPLPDGTFY
jgi:hypothetical protein